MDVEQERTCNARRIIELGEQGNFEKPRFKQFASAACGWWSQTTSRSVSWWLQRQCSMLSKHRSFNDARQLQVLSETLSNRYIPWVTQSTARSMKGRTGQKYSVSSMEAVHMKANQCTSMQINATQCTSMQISVHINANQCRSVQLGADRCNLVHINANQGALSALT
jgi:hypothetical protein